MGCAASTGSVGQPHGKAEDKGKRKDAQTTYRERLGQDFMNEFAKSQHSIPRNASALGVVSKSPSGSSTASAADTLAYDEATGSLVSPYTTPPKGLPGAGADVESDHPTGPLSGSMPYDTRGPFMCSSKDRKESQARGHLRHSSSERSLPVSRPGSRESMGSVYEKRDAARSNSSVRSGGTLRPSRGSGGTLRPLSGTGSINGMSAAPGGPQRSPLVI